MTPTHSNMKSIFNTGQHYIRHQPNGMAQMKEIRIIFYIDSNNYVMKNVCIVDGESASAADAHGQGM